MMRRGALLALVLVACVGCGVRPSGAIPGLPAPSGPVNGVTLFLIGDDQLVPVLRATATQLTAVEAVTLLAGGPTSDETSGGLSSQVPPNIVPVDVTDEGSGTTLNMAIDPTQLSTLAVDQLVCTVREADAQTAPVTTGGGFFVAGAGHTIGPLRCPRTR